jgi:quinol monooxygenase YgiN
VTVPIVVATITPNPGQMDAVEEALKELIPVVQAEDGCEKYSLHRGADRFVIIEKWRDTDALGAHGANENMKLFGQKLAGLVGGRPDIQILEAVSAGDDVKGSI